MTPFGRVATTMTAYFTALTWWMELHSNVSQVVKNFGHSPFQVRGPYNRFFR